jgi:hypothetical protein
VTRRPRYHVRRMPRLQVQGDYTVRALDYARGSQSGQVQPTGDLNAKLEAIERHFFIVDFVAPAPSAGDCR